MMVTLLQRCECDECHIKLAPDETAMSFELTTLFVCIPSRDALKWKIFLFCVNVNRYVVCA